MAPYSVSRWGRTGISELMASSDAAALERARQLLDQLDLEVWSVGEKSRGCRPVGERLRS
jgi:hypothetical protein